MPGIPYLCIRFNQNIFPYEIFRFRAAVIEHTNRSSAYFHNHTHDGDSIYRYPQIQYKVTFKKASIVCIHEAVDEIHRLFSQPNLELKIGERKQCFEVEKLVANRFNVNVWNNTFDYSLLNWLALNQKHYQRWKELDDDPKSQIELLQSILTGNILAFAKGINWFVDQPVKVSITKIKQIKPLPFKGRDMFAFSLNFQSNVSLPNYIGVGKGASIGFGVVKRVRRGTKQLEDN